MKETKLIFASALLLLCAVAQAQNGITWNPWKKVGTNLSYHYLATATQLDKHERTLGYEIEFSASYQVRKEAKLSAGYSYMRGTETMVYLKRTSESRQLQWAWVMFTITPQLYTNKK